MLTPRSIQIIAESKIEHAIETGEFDNLPGFGKPFEFDVMNCDDNWWIRRKMEIEQIKQLQQENRGDKKQ